MLVTDTFWPYTLAIELRQRNNTTKKVLTAVYSNWTGGADENVQAVRIQLTPQDEKDVTMTPKAKTMLCRRLVESMSRSGLL